MAKTTPKGVQEQIKELALNGKSTREISKILEISQSTASRLIKKCRLSQYSKPRGRPRILDKYDEKYICRLATTGKCSTSIAIKNELEAYSGILASSNTIMRTLRRQNIRSRYK